MMLLEPSPAAYKKKHPVTKQGAFFMRPGGFEPLAFRVGAERSIQLSYDRTITDESV